ncbi:hypothetical protein SAMN02745150_00916 [Brevinema andersonii]|uniref:Uncharacterized protein n=1 Tax=Brevinema andersonii TaxID=34097 RepID=A0A1I1E2N4_BREAD|nr:hypothetical protein [Brevinema andersonii]SFB81475.1 hypothetical protein SAMN02745150_00916 [Brevinema andersonii]
MIFYQQLFAQNFEITDSPTLDSGPPAVEAQTVKEISSSWFKLPSFKISTETLIVSGGIFFFLVLAYYVILIHRALKRSLESAEYIEDIYLSIYVSDQIKDYVSTLNEYNHAHSDQDRINARTQLWNLLNRISRQICETKNEDLANKLGDAFFAKIQGRYLKMSPIPDGVIYFRTVAELLIRYTDQYEGDILTRKIRRDYKAGLTAQKKFVAEISQKNSIFSRKRDDSQKTVLLIKENV